MGLRFNPDIFKKKQEEQDPSESFLNIFRPQEEPSNYVEQSSQKVDPLKKFFDERTPPAAKPITEEKKQAIKSEFAPQKKEAKAPEQASQENAMAQDEFAFDDAEIPQVAPKQEAAPSIQRSLAQEEVSPEDLLPEIDREKAKRKRISDLAEAQLPERDWTSFLPYLAPMLVGVLEGGSYGTSAGIAGNALLKAEEDRVKRKQSLEDKLMELEKSKLSKKSSSRYQLKQLRDRVTGQPEMGSYDPTTDTMYVRGVPVDTSQYELSPGMSTQEFERRQGIMERKQRNLGDYFGRGVRLDPETGLLARVINGKLTPIQVSSGSLNPQQRKELKGIVDGFKTTDSYKKNAEIIRTAGTLKELIAKNNPIALEMARSELAKIAEGGGRLTDKDVERLGGSKAIDELAKRFVYLQKNKLPATEKDRYYMMEVANALDINARRNLSSSIMGFENDFIQRGGIPGAVQTAIMPLVPQLSRPQSSAKMAKPDGVLVEMLDSNGKGTGKFGTIPKDKLQKALESKKYRLKPQGK